MGGLNPPENNDILWCSVDEGEKKGIKFLECFEDRHLTDDSHIGQKEALHLLRTHHHMRLMTRILLL